jgi:hypothetical protein
MAVAVKYKGNTYLWYGKSKLGHARLLKSDGTKYSGTPTKDKLVVLHKKLQHRDFNGHKYVMTKQGVFSCTTGNPVINPDITKLFK